MKSQQETIAELALRMGYIYYHRPLMYGGTPEGVDLLLYHLHSLWAFIVEREDEFETVCRDEMEREDCGSADFATRYAMNHPSASQDEVAAYVAKHWSIISARLNVPIPNAQLEAEFGG